MSTEPTAQPTTDPQPERMLLSRARMIANALVLDLTPYCERIEIAGSIRRNRPTVEGIELLAIAKWSRDPDRLFDDESVSLLQRQLARRVGEGRLHPLIWGAKQARFRLVKSGAVLDLFVVTPDTWGVQMLIRTGPAEFSKRFVTQQSKGGLLPDDLRVAEGRIWDGDTPVHTPEERDLFAAIGMDWIAPEKRGRV